MEKMLGIINPDGYERVNRVYDPSGDSPTITARDYKDPIKILDMREKDNRIAEKRREEKRREEKRREEPLNRCMIIGQMDNTQDHTFESANRVYSSLYCAPTIPTSCGGGHTPKVLIKRIDNE